MLKDLLPRTWTGIVAAGVLAPIALIAWTEWKEKSSAVAQLTKSEMEVKRLQSELERAQRAPTQAKESPERDTDFARQITTLSQRIKEQDAKLDTLQSERDQLKRALERQTSAERTEPHSGSQLSQGGAPNARQTPASAPARQSIELQAGSPVVVDQVHTITLNYTRSYGGQFVINGQKYSSQPVGRRLSLPAVSGKKCFLEVMTLSPEATMPNTARLDYVCPANS